MEAVVKFAYEREQDDEIDLAPGDIVTDVTKVEDGWCSGTLNGRKGLFPENFVEVRPKSEPEPPPVLRNEATDKGARKRRAKVTFSYVAENEDELSLDLTDIVEILGEEEEGWWRGRCNGKEGVFPSNFVDPINEEVEAEDPPAYTNFTPSKPAEKGRPPSMIAMPGLGGINPNELRQKLKPVQPKGDTRPTPGHPSPHSSSSSLLQKAKVMFPYEADQPDEITVEEGEIVEVITKDTAQDGWWKVKAKKGSGFVPDNFLALIENTGPNTNTPSKPPPPTVEIDNPPLPPKSTPGAPIGTRHKPIPGSTRPAVADVPPKLPSKQPDLPPKDTPSGGNDLDIPRQEILNVVKDRPKRMARPPSHVSSSDVTEEGLTDETNKGGGNKAPWLEEMSKRKQAKQVPPTTAAAAEQQPPPPLTNTTSGSNISKPAAPAPKPAPHTRPKPTTTAKPNKPALPSKTTSEQPPSAPSPTPPPVTKPTAVGSTVNRPPPPVTTTTKEEVKPPSPIIPVAVVPQNNNEWKEAFEKLQEQFKAFKEDMHQMMKKEIDILAKDLDDERKKMAAMQIDIDRLKKSREFRDN